MIKKNYEEYIVEFRVTMVDLTYSKLLSDADGLQSSDVKQELTDRVRTTLQRQEVGMGCINYRRVDNVYLAPVDQQTCQSKSSIGRRSLLHICHDDMVQAC